MPGSKAAENKHQEILSKLDQIGWRLEWEPRFKIYLRFLEGEKEARILDLGCGVTASFLRLLKKEGFKDLFGLEQTKAAAEEAQKHGIKVLVGDIEKDDLGEIFSGQKFDFVIFGEVIEHLFEPQEALKKIQELLKPQGKLIISTPNAGFWTNKVLLKFFPRYLPIFSTSYGPKDHRHHFKINHLTGLLNQAGYKVLSWQGTPRWLRRPVKKTLVVKLVVAVENLVCRLTNPLSAVFPTKFGQYLVVKAGKNEKRQN